MQAASATATSAPPTPQLELAIVEYLGWFSNARLHESLGDIPPVEFEQLQADREAITLAGATA
jgi:transposase InsO family protein